MDIIVVLLRAFVWIGSLYIGIKSINILYYYVRYRDIDAAKYRQHLWLAISIALLILVPVEFLYTVVTHVPNRNFTINVDYTVDGTYYTYDDMTFQEMEVPIHETGTAPLEISIISDSEEIDAGENYYGGSIIRTINYTNIYAYGITLDCFNNHHFTLDSEVKSNSVFEEEMEYGDYYFDLEVSIGQISDKTIGYSFEDKLHDTSIEKIIETIILWIFALLGVIVFFIADRIFLKELKQIEDQ